MSIEKQPLWTRMAAPLALSATLLTGCTVEPLSDVISEAIVAAATPKCPAPSHENLAFADKLMQLQQQKEPVARDPNETSEIMARQDTARSLGLTVFAPSAGLVKLWEEDGHALRSSPSSVYLEEARRYMANYGVEIHVGTTPEDAPLDRRMRNPNAKERKSDDMKALLVTLTKEYSNLPEEYVDIAGLKKIIIVSQDKLSISGYAAAPGGVPLNVLNIDTGNTAIRHELFHLVDSALCGGGDAAAHDPAFDRDIRDLPEFYDNTKRARSYPSISGEDSFTKRNGFLQQMAAADERHDKPAFCSAEEAYNSFEASAVTVTGYHSTSVVEPKAELADALTSPGMSGEVTTRHRPIIREQSAILLARLAGVNEALADYFTRTGNSHFHPAPAYDCD